MINTDYKAQFAENVDAIIASNIEDRTERMASVKALIDRYISDYNVPPDMAQLERLSNYILREELTDNRPDKVALEEYPIMSERQLERRRSSEVPLKVAEEYGADGRNYRVPKRRKLSTREMIFVDQHAKIRNKVRADQYRRDTAPSKIAVYHAHTGRELSEPFVKCRGLGERWASGNI